MSTIMDPAEEIYRREIVTTRMLHTPREKVFAAWTDPKLLAQWWGPNGFTNTFSEFDLRPGGAWKFVMHGPDGKNYPNHSVFAEITPPERIVFNHLVWPIFRITATFDDVGGKTKLTFRMLFNTAAECEQVKAFALDANEQNFDRLAALLAQSAG